VGASAVAEGATDSPNAANGTSAEYLGDAPVRKPEPVDEARSSGPVTAAQEEPGVHLNGFAPLSDPAEDAEAISLSSKVTPIPQGPQPRRPPVTYTHWSQRPEVRVGFTLAPLLTLLALRRVRARRSESRPGEVDEQSFSFDPKPSSGYQQPHWVMGDRRQPERAPGDRRRGDRRRSR
jgi:hypothetical protein